MAELIFFRRGDEVLRFGLERPRVVLGRGDKCDVVIPDPEVSRQQAAITIDGTKVTLQDLSGKGTLRLPKHVLCCQPDCRADVFESQSLQRAHVRSVRNTQTLSPYSTQWQDGDEGYNFADRRWSR